MAGNKSVRLFLLGDNTDAKTKIEMIDAAADDLAAKHPELKIGIDSAAAQEKIALLRAEMKGAADDTSNTQSKLGLFGTALNELVTGGISPNISEMNLFQKAMLGLNIATGIGEPALAGLTTIVMGLGAGLVSAGVGLGVFGAASKTYISGLTTNIEAYGAALATGNSSAAGMALQQKNVDASLKGLNATQQDTVSNLGLMVFSWKEFANSVGPSLNKVLDELPGLFNTLLTQGQKFFGPVSTALANIVGYADKLANSKGFSTFMDQFAKASGPNLEAIGKSIINIIAGLGGIIKAFLPLSTTMTAGLEDITAKFAKWGETLSSHSGFQSLTSMAHTDGPLLVSVLKNLGEAVKNVVGAMGGLSTFSNSHVLLEILNPLSSILAMLSSHPDLVNLALWGYTAYSAFSKLNTTFTTLKDGFTALTSIGPKLTQAASAMGLLREATVAETEAQEGADVAMEANPIGILIVGIVALVAAFVLLWNKSSAFRDFWKDVWRDIEGAAVAVFDWVKGHWPLILGILTGPIGLAVVEIATHWDQIIHGVESMYDTVIGWFKRLPGNIVSALGDLGNLLLNAGRAILEGFLHGLEDAWGDVTNFVSGIAGWISSHKGPIEVDAVLLRPHGRAIMGGLVGGLQDGMPALTSQLARTTQAIANTSIPSAAGTASSSTTTAEWIGGAGADQEFITWLKKNIRVRGGNPAVLGR